jgi:uncharacterized damage-inducible protein DinB
MTIAELLLQDYDVEAKGIRKTLELIPPSLADYKPHEKSMAMGRLAMHVATLPWLGRMVVTSEDTDFTALTYPKLVFTTTEAAVEAFDQTSTELRAALETQSDEHLQSKWKLTFGGKPVADAPRSLLFRTMFLNHEVHHRAQLGVYLRLNHLPVPALYGPSADDRMGF